MDERWIIVATWGDPIAWKEVNYVVPLKIPVKSCRDLWREGEREVERKIESSIKSSSATVAIARSIWGEEEKGDSKESGALLKKIVIVVSETLGGCRDSINQDGRRCLEYIKESARNYISDYIKKFFGSVHGIENIVDIIIAPGIGLIDTSERRIFRCNPANYAVMVFSELLKIFLEVEPTTVIVDITHGINYMPHILVLMVEKAFKTYILKQYISRQQTHREGSSEEEKSYKIIVVNSDPYIQSRRTQQYRESENILYINIISCEEIELNEESYKAILEELILNIDKVLKTPQSPKAYRFKEVRDVKEVIKSLTLDEYNDEIAREIKDFKDFMKTLKHGLILPTIYKVLELRSQGKSDCLKILYKALEYMDHEKLIYSKCRCGGNEGKDSKSLEVYRKIWLDPNVLSLAVGSCFVKENIYGMINRTINQDNLFSLEMLKKLLDHIPSTVAYEIAKNELHDIERRAKHVARLFEEEVIDRLYPYYVIYDIYDAVEGVSVFEALKSEPEDIKKMLRDVHKARCDKIDRRNFYAHAGYEKNITLIRIRKHGEDFLIELSYDKDCLERIYKIVGEIK